MPSTIAEVEDIVTPILFKKRTKAGPSQSRKAAEIERPVIIKSDDLEPSGSGNERQDIIKEIDEE